MGFKRILIIHPEGNAGNNPTIKSLIDLLLESKFQVTYLSSVNTRFPIITGVSFLKRSGLIEKIKKKLFNKYCLVKLSKIFSFLKNLYLINRYDLVLSIDREGLIEASAISDLLQVPLIHASFEIYFESETSKNYKKIEIRASKKICLWIVQDEIRAESLVKENHLSRSNAVILPLASEGLGEVSKPRLRDGLGIPVDKKVAIFMGSLYKWTMIDELINQIDRIPDDWAIIIHERYGDADRYLPKDFFQARAMSGKLFVNNFAVENVDKMGYVLAGVDVGLAFYRPTYEDPSTGKNLKYLGLASGKISTYLRYGVPIIMNEIGLYADHSREFMFGLVISDLEQLPDTLASFHTHKNLSDNAKKYFSTFLDFKLHKKELRNKIHALIS
jgi:hypothetical protein